MKQPPKFLKGLFNKALSVLRTPKVPYQRVTPARGTPERAHWDKFGSLPDPALVERTRTLKATLIPKATAIPKARPVSAQQHDVETPVAASPTTYGVRPASPLAAPPRMRPHDLPPTKGPRPLRVQIAGKAGRASSISSSNRAQKQQQDDEEETGAGPNIFVKTATAGATAVGSLGGLLQSAEGPMGGMAPEIHTPAPIEFAQEPMFGGPTQANVATAQTYWMA